MSNAFDHENTPYAGHGEFDSFDVTADWTDADWAEYDEYVAREMEEFDAHTQDMGWDLPDMEPPF